ncbi:hypothetical protein ACKLNO_08215 [Neisseriaceae bacterium B1]
MGFGSLKSLQNLLAPLNFVSGCLKRATSSFPHRRESIGHIHNPLIKNRNLKSKLDSRLRGNDGSVGFAKVSAYKKHQQQKGCLKAMIDFQAA